MDDVRVTCVLPWSGEERVIWCDYNLFTTIDHWNVIANIGKFKPLVFTIKFDDEDYHAAALEKQQLGNARGILRLYYH